MPHTRANFYHSFSAKHSHTYIQTYTDETNSPLRASKSRQCQARQTSESEAEAIATNSPTEKRK